MQPSGAGTLSLFALGRRGLVWCSGLSSAGRALSLFRFINSVAVYVRVQGSDDDHLTHEMRVVFLDVDGVLCCARSITCDYEEDDETLIHDKTAKGAANRD